MKKLSQVSKFSIIIFHPPKKHKRDKGFSLIALVLFGVTACTQIAFVIIVNREYAKSGHDSHDFSRILP
jgi:hypothetical protein